MEVRRTDNGVCFSVKVRPRAGRDRLTGGGEAVLRVEVSAPPAGGQANRKLLRLLSKSLGVPQESVSIVRGRKSRQKLIRVAGLSPADLRRKFDEQSLR